MTRRIRSATRKRWYVALADHGVASPHNGLMRARPAPKHYQCSSQRLSFSVSWIYLNYKAVYPNGMTGICRDLADSMRACAVAAVATHWSEYRPEMLNAPIGTRRTRCSMKQAAPTAVIPQTLIRLDLIDAPMKQSDSRFRGIITRRTFSRQFSAQNDIALIEGSDLVDDLQAWSSAMETDALDRQLSRRRRLRLRCARSTRSRQAGQGLRPAQSPEHGNPYRGCSTARCRDSISTDAVTMQPQPPRRLTDSKIPAILAASDDHAGQTGLKPGCNSAIDGKLRCLVASSSLHINAVTRMSTSTPRASSAAKLSPFRYGPHQQIQVPRGLRSTTQVRRSDQSTFDDRCFSRRNSACSVWRAKVAFLKALHSLVPPRGGVRHHLYAPDVITLQWSCLWQEGEAPQYTAGVTLLPQPLPIQRRKPLPVAPGHHARNANKQNQISRSVTVNAREIIALAYFGT